MFKALWQDESGQTTTEYILILSVVVLVAMKFRGTFTTEIQKVMESTFKQMDSATQPDSN
jgi:Flp pilus assembly pilin Flp